MENIGITTISSKGQIVIPLEMRKGLVEGERMIVIRAGDKLIIKKTSDFEKNVEEDLKFAKRTEEAWKKYGEGKFKNLPMDRFLLELKKC